MGFGFVNKGMVKKFFDPVSGESNFAGRGRAILFDPIFQGFAVSLILGEVAVTVLNRFVVPVLYYWLVGAQRESLIGVRSWT